MKKTTLKLDGVEYELSTYCGAWAKSRERVPVGTVRVIGGMLMYAWTRHDRGLFRSPEVLWSPVDRAQNTPEEACKWFSREFA